MDYSLCNVALSEIDQEDQSFHITTTSDKSPLLESIAKIGVLVPPALRRNTAGLTIVSGFRRIHACQQAGIQTIAVRMVADDLPPLDYVRLAVTENNSQRPLNLIETARAVRQLRTICSHDQAFFNELAILGLPTAPTMIDKLDRLDQLETGLQSAIVAGAIGLNTALAIGVLSAPDQLSLQAIFTQIQMSVSKQKEIMAMAQDIAGRDQKTVQEVLQSDTIRKIIADNDLDRNMKTAGIRRHLKQIRYPNLSKAETQYQQAISSLKLGPHTRIDPPIGFEGSTYTLSLRFRNRYELKTAHQKLGTALENPAMEYLFPK